MRRHQLTDLAWTKRLTASDRLAHALFACLLVSGMLAGPSLGKSRVFCVGPDHPRPFVPDRNGNQVPPGTESRPIPLPIRG